MGPMKDRQNQKGVALVAFALVFVALAAAAAIAIDIARLGLTATEVQALADTGANAGAIALVNGRDAVADAQSVARANQADGNPGVLNASDISKGHWEPATGWVSSSPFNAVHVEAHLTVDNIMAGAIFETPTTQVTKTATAVFQTLGTANPTLPIALAKCVTCYAKDCSVAPITLYFNRVTKDTAWILFGGSGTSSIEQYIPDGCKGGGAKDAIPPPTVSAGSSISLDNGAKTALCTDFTCLVNQTFLVPVVDAACGSSLNSFYPIIGFATVKITKVVCSPSCVLGVCSESSSTCTKDSDCPKYITLQPRFTDCRDPGDKDLCKGSSYGGSCPGCGTGSVALVE